VARDRPIYSLTHEFYPRRAGIAVYVEELARGAVAAGRRVQVWVPDAPELAEHPGFPFTVHRSSAAVPGQSGSGLSVATRANPASRVLGS
jgi:phosphatidylinositol alpha-1,6-mannosyltransferase